MSDQGFEDWMRGLFHIEEPLTGYALPYLLDAEAGRLRYDTDRYRIHAVPNNARALQLCGLLAYGPDGMVLTEVGRARLARERADRPGNVAHFESDAALGVSAPATPVPHRASRQQAPPAAVPQRAQAVAEQLLLGLPADLRGVR